MQDFWSFLFSPLGLLVYVAYRILKLCVWIFVLPRVLPFLPARLATRIETLRAGLLNRLMNNPVKRAWTNTVAWMPRAVQGCCQ